MRRFLSAALAVLLVVAPAGGATAQNAGAVPGMADIAAAIDGIEALILDVDKMIADQETRLEALYERREAADPGAPRQSVDTLIDRLTLQLDQVEALRATLAEQAAALQAALHAVDDDPTQAGDSDE